MRKTIQIFGVLLAFILLGLPAQSKVTPVHEYNTSNINSSTEETINCDVMGYFSQAQENAVCTKKTIAGGTTCYDCHCGSEYKYLCNTTGMTPSGNKCSADGTAKYSSCACASGYISSSSVTTGLASISYPTPVEEKGIKCYKTSAFACASGYKSFTSNPSEGGITYTTQSPYSGSTLKCVSGYTKTDKYMTSVPSGYDCMTRSSVYLSLLKSPIYLYYFTGCSDSGNCTSTLQDCLTSSSQKSNGITCYKITGCQSGVVKGSSSTYMCLNSKSSSANSKYYTYTTISRGDVSCLKITGCTSPYEKAYIGTTVDKSKYALGDVYSYEVQELISGSGQIICRTPNGCNAQKGYYDYTCPSGCWNGILSWWKQYVNI